MLDIGVSTGIGFLVGGFGLMMMWGLVWLVIGAVGAIRGTCGWMIVLSSLSATVIASLCAGGCSGLRRLTEWGAEALWQAWRPLRLSWA